MSIQNITKELQLAGSYADMKRLVDEFAIVKESLRLALTNIENNEFYEALATEEEKSEVAKAKSLL